MIRHLALKAGLLAASAALLAQPALAQTTGEQLHISAWAVDLSTAGSGANATVDFTINRWSAPDERERLVTTMLEGGGQDALLKQLQKMPSHGRMRFPSWQGPDPLNLGLGWDLRYAWQEPLPDGGRRIVLALDRYMSLWETANRPRTVDYPFTVIELRVNKAGQGEGKMSVATKIRFDRQQNMIELENYTSEPVRLKNVTLTTKT
jgi:hypothetical protein